MGRHMKMITLPHLRKYWQKRVKTWFDQPGRKHRRRQNRENKAKLIAPCPTHKLRPIVRGQTNKYNNKMKLGRGFTLEELKKAGISSALYAKSIGIAIDCRRKDTNQEAQNQNVNRIKEYLSRMILFPRNPEKPAKKPIVKEATKAQMESAEAKEQNTTKTVIPFPKPEDAYKFEPITDAMKKEITYKKQRTEHKTAKGWYRRMEEMKKKAEAKKK